MKKMLSLCILLVLNYTSNAQTVSIIPEPVSISQQPGFFVLNKNVGIGFNHKDVKNLAVFLQTHVQKITGQKLEVSPTLNQAIVLKLDTSIQLPEEGYLLEITNTKVIAKANSIKGLFYSVQSLVQLMPAIRTNQIVRLPNLKIEDYPKFNWRGMHLDVSRHFFSLDFIKEYIDLMSLYKLNTFHWHLVDDQGWRIEIKKYPALTKVGAWRVDYTKKLWVERPQAQKNDTADYGGFYTQIEIAELIKYAKERNITVVPEIEMPGHVASAIASIPNLSCTSNFQLPLTGGNYTNILSNYCVGKEETFGFIEDVLNEVIDLFPSTYIHIGGDEVDKRQWKECKLCQKRIVDNGLKNEDELQSYFIKRVENIILKRGRKMIGWDEIIEGGLAPTAAVMSWRGEAGGIQAAKMKHNVVMTPGSPLYFDHYQAGPEGEPFAIGGFNNLKKVYQYNPIPNELSINESKYILGAQANLWTEYITTPSQVEYMVLPRMLALSESLWSPVEKKDFNAFSAKLDKHFKSFDQKGLNYCKGNFTVDITPINKENNLFVSLNTEVPITTIRFTEDGTMPTFSSELYTTPISIDKSKTIKAICFKDGNKMNLIPTEQQFVFHKAINSVVSYKNLPFSGYMANGINSLTDGIRGKNAVNKYWHGFDKTNLDATINLGSVKEVHKISLGCLQAYKDWIFMPEKIEFYMSNNGVDYNKIGEIQNDVSPQLTASTIKDFTLTLDKNISTKFIKVIAYPLASCPKGHPGVGKPTWIFADELIVE